MFGYFRVVVLEPQKLPTQQHIDAVAALVAETGHSISALESTVDVHRYTCAVYAFELAGDPSYEDIALWSEPDVFAGPDFVHWLMDGQRLAAVNEGDEKAGALVVYLEGEKFKRIGVMRAGGRVDSKWGTHGRYNHGLWEVPASYGDELRYFKPLTYDEAITYLRDFAKEQGVEFDDDDKTGREQHHGAH